MKICINIKVWQRPRVFENVLRSIRDQETKHEIEILCGLSGDDPYLHENEGTAWKYDARVYGCDNRPLSTKANQLCTYSKDHSWDYLMILGSDDVVGPGFFDAYDFTQPTWGWTDLYMYVDKSSRQLGGFLKVGDFVYWPGYTGKRAGDSVGAGRVLRRDVVERLGFKLHADGLDRNLDWSTTQLVDIPAGPLPEGVYMVDCKDDVSVTKLEDFDQSTLTEMDVPLYLEPYL